MKLHGKNLIAGEPVVAAAGYLSGRGDLAKFEEATETQVHLAFEAAEKAFQEFRRTSPVRRAAFLERIAEEIDLLGDDLLTTGKPIVLQDENPRGIWRLVDGHLTREKLQYADDLQA
jgi:acyl-CoA reductase-like NAD-dependent aldehyde dehydrogenase